MAYLVCSTPRSGSSLFCEALWRTGVAGQPDEYFRPNNLDKLLPPGDDLAGYCRTVFQSGLTPNGVAGAKVMWGDLERLVARMADKTPNVTVSTVENAFPRPKYIWILRRDKTRQAVSLSKAAQSNIWRVEEGNQCSPAKEPVFSLKQIDDYVRVLERHDACWRKFFATISADPLIITYEDLLEDYERTVRRGLQYLGLFGPGVAVPPPRLIRQADAQSEEWVRRYRAHGVVGRLSLWAKRATPPRVTI